MNRDRKLKVAFGAMAALFLGLVACLLTALGIEDSMGLLVGLYTPFGVGIGAVLKFFVDANVKVHEAGVEK